MNGLLRAGVIGTLGLFAIGWWQTAHPPPTAPSTAASDVPAAPARKPATKAADAAEIGDIVTIRYPASTIMCEDVNDLETVYIAGELALRETYRIENDAPKAAKAELQAQKSAMANAYSCKWAPSKGRYVVKAKSVSGSKDDLFHVARYCLKPEGNTDDKCWFIEATASRGSQIDLIR